MDAVVKNKPYTGFQPGNPGRPKGARNKIATRQLRDAREAFLPLAEEMLGIMKRHLHAHRKGEDCATCRHYADIIFQYSFGRPPQRIEVEVQAARDEAIRIADELGLSDNERKAAIAEAEAILRARV